MNRTDIESHPHRDHILAGERDNYTNHNTQVTYILCYKVICAMFYIYIYIPLPPLRGQWVTILNGAVREDTNKTVTFLQT